MVERQPTWAWASTLGRGRPRAFLLAPADPTPLGFFRIAIASVALAQVIMLWPYLGQLYGNLGFVQWALLEASRDAWYPSIGKLSLALRHYGVGADAVTHAVFSIYAASLVGLALGWKTRVFAVVAWLAHALCLNSGLLSLYGVDTMIHISLFYCVWMPVGSNLSLDRLPARRPAEPSWLANLALRTLQIHLCIIYWNSGTAKAFGTEWWSGEALWRALMTPQFSAFDFTWLAHAPYLAQAICWAVMAIEVGYPALIWPMRTRRLWLAATIGLHVGIALFMGLTLFALTLIVMNVAAFGFGLTGGGRRATAEGRREPDGVTA